MYPNTKSFTLSQLTTMLENNRIPYAIIANGTQIAHDSKVDGNIDWMPFYYEDADFLYQLYAVTSDDFTLSIQDNTMYIEVTL